MAQGQRPWPGSSLGRTLTFRHRHGSDRILRGGNRRDLEHHMELVFTVLPDRRSPSICSLGLRMTHEVKNEHDPLTSRLRLERGRDRIEEGKVGGAAVSVLDSGFELSLGRVHGLGPPGRA